MHNLRDVPGEQTAYRRRASTDTAPGAGAPKYEGGAGRTVPSVYRLRRLKAGLRLVIHDYSGHPGQVHLSRELARRGHHVEHQYCASYTTGRGATARRDSDPESFTVRAIELSSEFARYSPILQLCQELQYARKSAVPFWPHGRMLRCCPTFRCCPCSY